MPSLDALAKALRMNHTGMTNAVAAWGLVGGKGMNRSGSWATLGSAALLLALSSPAAAKATLNARFTNATCVLNTGLAAVSVDCSPLPEIGNAIGFDAVIPRGGSASVTATLVYTYTDDGLPLEDYGVFYLDANAFTWETTNFEAGALYATSNSCAGSRYCAHDPTLFIEGSTGFPPVLLGLNTVADRVTGSITLFSDVAVTPPYQFESLTTPVYVGWNAVTYSGVVPEPGTFLLTAAGFTLLLGSRAVRRRLGSESSKRGEHPRPYRLSIHATKRPEALTHPNPLWRFSCFARCQEWVKRGFGACVVACSLLAPASAQTFVNLDFEQARVPPWEPNQMLFLPWSEAAPGWSHSDGDSTEGVYYLNGHLGFSQAYILMGAPGSFAMGLRNGTFHEQEPRGEFVHSFLSQHGTIPVGTRELVLYSNDWNFRVEINGEPISMRPRRAGVPGVDYSLHDYIGDWTGDVSSFDGRAVDLKIINAYPASDYISHLLIVDDIRLLPIPEPPMHVLMAVGAAVLLCRVKIISRRKTAP